MVGRLLDGADTIHIVSSVYLLVVVVAVHTIQLGCHQPF